MRGFSVGELCGAPVEAGAGFCGALTYLTGIQALTPKDTFCGDFEVRRVGIDDHGRLPA